MPAKTPEPANNLEALKQLARDALGGSLRGAGSIGATALYPFDAAGLTGQTNQERRRAMDEGLTSWGANPDAYTYQASKLLTEIAGTAGAGGALAKGLTAIAPNATRAAALLESGGLAQGGLAAKTAAGTLTGAASAGLIDPEHLTAGGIIGGLLPGLHAGTKLAGLLGNGALDVLSEVAQTAKQAGLPVEKLFQPNLSRAALLALTTGHAGPLVGAIAGKALRQRILTPGAKRAGLQLPNLTKVLPAGGAIGLDDNQN